LTVVRLRAGAAVCVLVLLLTFSLVGRDALAEQSSDPASTATGLLDVGADHSCAVVAGAGLRCWGFGGDGRLGYGNLDTIGDYETPGSVGPVDLGVGRTATALSAGGFHTCAVLDDASVRCWGSNVVGQLGYGNNSNVGDNEPAGSAGPVYLGADRTAKAISAGGGHTCAVLDNGQVRCWGIGINGQLGYGSFDTVGDNETPGSVGPVDLGRDGTGRALTAVAVSAGRLHTCAILDDHSVRCWGEAGDGQLGYGNTNDIGVNETPGSVGPVDLGRDAAGRVLTAVAISAGARHTCAILDDHSVRCWGYAGTGQLGYANYSSIGDDETPGLAGPVNLEAGDGGAGCPAVPSGPTATSVPPAASVLGSAPTTPPPPGLLADGLAAQQIRAAGLRLCVRRVSRHALRQRNRVRHLPTIARAIAFRRIARRARHGRGLCLVRYGRTPGRVGTLSARATGPRTITLSFQAAGTDHAHPPAAHGYLIGQSTHPIRTRRDFRAAHALCRGRCVFDVTLVGATLTQTIIGLDRRRTYYYAIAARDNVSRRLGPRSHTIQARTP